MHMDLSEYQFPKNFDFERAEIGEESLLPANENKFPNFEDSKTSRKL